MARVLVVDDDVELAWVLGALLQAFGYDATTVSNGAEGLLKMGEALPDAVLCDVEMPVLDGPSMMRRMLIEDCGKENIPVVLISGVPDLPLLAAQHGTPYYVEKPVSGEQLRTILQRAITERQPPHPMLGEDPAA